MRRKDTGSSVNRCQCGAHGRRKEGTDEKGTVKETPARVTEENKIIGPLDEVGDGMETINMRDRVSTMAKYTGGTGAAEATAVVDVHRSVPVNADVQTVRGGHWHAAVSCVDIKDSGL